MRYLGGKYRIANHIVSAIETKRKPGQLVWDAFCGGLSVTKKLLINGPVYSTDVCWPLVCMYKAIQNGWIPPETISEEEYRAAKHLPDENPLKAFCGFGCSYGGKWFGGYARVHPSRPNTPPYKSSRKFLLDVVPRCQIDHVDFNTTVPGSVDAILYLDPPYKGTHKYSASQEFSHEQFEQKVREWSRYQDMFISERQFDLGSIVWEGKSPAQVCFKPNEVERLYYIAKGSL